MSGDSGSPLEAVSAADLAALLDRVQADPDRAAELLTVTGALAAGELLERDEASWELRDPLIAALAGLVLEAPTPEIQDDALFALVALDAAKATTACYRLFGRSLAQPGGPGGRWLERLTGVVDPSVDALVAGLLVADNLRAVLASRALAERGVQALPALRSALAAQPVPAVPDSPGWWAGETAKYRIMKALQWLGPVAAPAAPLVVALLDDEHGYRDTRHQAQVTLDAMSALDDG